MEKKYEKTKLLKTLLVPTFGMVAAIATSCNNSDVPTPDRYVVLTANKDSTLEFIDYNEADNDLQYSTDQKNWNTYNEKISIPKGTSLYLRGDNATITDAPNGAFAQWVIGVADNGSFYYNGSDTEAIKNFGFPEGWVLNPELNY